MLKGYTMPMPGASDGEYGGFGGCHGCGPSRYSGFNASPATRPYWEGQGIARTIPALDGYSYLEGPRPDAMEGDGEMLPREQAAVREAFSMPAPSSLVPFAIGGAVGGLIARFLGFPTLAHDARWCWCWLLEGLEEVCRLRLCAAELHANPHASSSPGPNEDSDTTVADDGSAIHHPDVLPSAGSNGANTERVWNGAGYDFDDAPNSSDYPSAGSVWAWGDGQHALT